MIRSKLIGFEVCLVKKAHILANYFATKHKDVTKARQVYHNTLAVWAVNYYMKCMQIEANWEASDSWDIIMQSLLDVADLVLPEIGKLECRPVMEDEQSVYIPFDVSQERLAYVIVQLNSSLKKAIILGFVKAVDAEEFSTNKLQSLNDLLHLIEQTKISNLASLTIQLSKWFAPENKFENQWLPLPVIFKNSLRENLALSVRSSESMAIDDPKNSLATVSRGKVLNFGIQAGGHQVALVIRITDGEDGNFDILAQVQPIDSLHVPPGLKLEVIDDTDSIFLTAEARCEDRLIQLNFFGLPKEKFKIKLALGNDSITEHFII